MKTTKTLIAALATAAFAFGCSDGKDAGTDTGVPDDSGTQVPAGSTVGGEGTTFDHDNTLDVDPFELLARLEQEGPPDFRARIHSCPKVRYGTLGRILASRGVNLANTAVGSAGEIYANADQALGVANYGARVSESSQLTTASAAKMFDIFVAAAPEIIANMSTQADCQVGGQGVSMFNAQGQCTVDGVSCLIGAPASISHMELCNRTVNTASSPERGRVIAVAALAAAAHTCE